MNMTIPSFAAAVSRRKVHRLKAGPLVALALSVCLLPRAGSAGDDKSWLLADRSEKEIIAFVQSLDTAESTVEFPADAPAVCLTHERIMQLESGKYRVSENAVYRVFNAERADVAKQHFRFSTTQKIEATAAWVLRDGKVIRGSSQDVTILKGGGDRLTEVIIAIPDVRDGDVVGWSLRRGRNRTYNGTTISLAEPHAVKVATLRVLTDGWIAYRILGRNLVPGSYDVQVLERQRGTETHTLATVRDIMPVRDEPFAAPRGAASPIITLSWRGSLDKTIGRWWFVASWEEVAVWIEDVLEEVMAYDKAFAATARDLVADIAEPRDRLTALHDFVREQVVLVDDDELRADDRTASEILASRTASPFEAGLLLCALGRAVGLPTRPVLARSHDLGSIDQGNPSLQQFSDVVVESLDDPEFYYVPAREECPAGILPADLVGASAMALAPDLASKNRKVIGEVFSSSESDQGRLLARYQDEVSRLKWQHSFKLPGNPEAVQGVVSETVHWTAGGDTASVAVAIEGYDAALGYLTGRDEAKSRLEAYCSEHYPAAQVVTAEDGEGEVAIRGSLKLGLSQPGEDTWLLPADSIFGTPFLDDWDGPDRGPFHFPVARAIRRTWRAALPSGWKLATPIAPLEVRHPRFVVTERVGIINGDLLVIREIRLLRGTTPRDQLAGLDEAVSRVRRFEQTPLVLVRDEAAGR